MTRDQADAMTQKAIEILIDQLPAAARAILRERMIEQGAEVLPTRKTRGAAPANPPSGGTSASRK